MTIQIRTKEITLTEKIEGHIQTAIENFKRYHLDMTTVNVVLAKEKKGVSVEFDIHIAHNGAVVISQTDDNLDAAIDLAIERANKALRRLHDRVKSHRGGSLRDVEVVEA